MRPSPQRLIEVWADWEGITQPTLLGTLTASPARGKEVFAFEYDAGWLHGTSAQNLDPSLSFFSGPQYPPLNKANFGMFLDSSPDRWGRFLMDRREALFARIEGRERRPLRESDYLLGVYDGNRMGGLRFRTEPNGPFLDDNEEFASPPWASLRELEHASLEIERPGSVNDPHFRDWLRILIAPGGSLGGARPKAGVVDASGHLWIAKFPSRGDSDDSGLWELVVHRLAQEASIDVAPSDAKRFNAKRHTFLTKRFDRAPSGRRVLFASAMTALNRVDGDDASNGASYLEIAEFIIQHGAHTDRDLEQLWRRIVFFICVSNADDHLRNHGFLLESGGWSLSPAYDMNPDPEAVGLMLNISDVENALELDVAREVAEYFRLKPVRAEEIIDEVTAAVSRWRQVAESLKMPRDEMEVMERAFRVVGSG